MMTDFVFRLGSYQLRIDVEDFSSVKTFALYGSFQVQSEKENYRLLLGPLSSGDMGEFPGEAAFLVLLI